MKLAKKIRPELVWSAFLVLMAGLLLRLMHVLLTALLLKAYAIGFYHHLFRITYKNVGGGYWTEGKVFMVYIAGTVAFLFLGSLLAFVLRKVRIKNIKLRLFLTWFSFFSVFLLPLQMIASLFVHDEIGPGLTLLQPGLLPMLVMAVFLLISGFSFRQLWLRMFLRTAPEVNLINQYNRRQRFIRIIFMQAMLAGAMPTIVYAIAAESATWLILIVLQILLVLGFAFTKLSEKTPRLMKTTHTFSISPTTLIIMLIASAAPLLLILF